MRPKSIGDNRVLVRGWDTAGKEGTKQTMDESRTRGYWFLRRQWGLGKSPEDTRRPQTFLFLSDRP